MYQIVQLLVFCIQLMKQGYLVPQLLFGVCHQCKQKSHGLSLIVCTLFHGETDKLHNGNIHVAFAIVSVGPCALHSSDQCILIMYVMTGKKERNANKSIHRLVLGCWVDISQQLFHEGLVLRQLWQCEQLYCIECRLSSTAMPISSLMYSFAQAQN